MQFLIFFLTLLPAFLFAEFKYQLSICMIFKDEAPYLKEWIEFHRLVGVEHFYLCSHNSSDNFREILRPYIVKGIVELTQLKDSNDKVDDFNKVQCKFYTKCLEKAKNVSKWVAFIDADEYLFPTVKKSLMNVLNSFKEYGAVTANWQMFGTSNVQKLDSNQLMIEHLTHCASAEFILNKHIKSIVQPLFVTHFFNPHYANFKPGYFQVNTDKVPFVEHESPYRQIDQLCINHYWTRDEYFFWNYKVKRQEQFWGPQFVEGAKDSLMILNQEVDLTIQRFVPRLKKRMFKGIKN